MNSRLAKGVEKWIVVVDGRGLRFALRSQFKFFTPKALHSTAQGRAAASRQTHPG